LDEGVAPVFSDLKIDLFLLVDILPQLESHILEEEKRVLGMKGQGKRSNYSEKIRSLWGVKNNSLGGYDA